MLRPIQSRISPETLPLGTGHHLADLQLDEFQPIRPNLAIELDLSLGDTHRRVELVIQLDRSGRPSTNYERFRRYDALLNGWAMAMPRYKALGEPPVVVFVVEDDEKAVKLLRAADRIMTGRVGKWGVPEAAWQARAAPDLCRRRARRPPTDCGPSDCRSTRPLCERQLGDGARDSLPSRSRAYFQPPFSGTAREPPDQRNTGAQRAA